MARKTADELAGASEMANESTPEHDEERHIVDLNQVFDPTPEQIGELAPAQIQSLTPEQIGKLAPTQIRALTSEQVSVLTSQQIKTLTPGQVRQLSPGQLKDLTRAQLTNLTRAQRRKSGRWVDIAARVFVPVFVAAIAAYPAYLVGQRNTGPEVVVPTTKPEPPSSATIISPRGEKPVPRCTDVQGTADIPDSKGLVVATREANDTRLYFEGAARSPFDRAGRGSEVH